MSEDVGMSVGRKAAYSVNEFCSMYSIGRTLFYDEVDAGRLRIKKAGTKTLVLASDADKWAQSLPDGGAA
ncbi:helix-turn-helix domain-containing protein [Shinella yambaruensis]|uniref:DNA-binding protein n=1 Tax=Shinella yambaruensis TaxID=415996 RepID=A0ABQ5ZUT1_9HYPH|nr:helix-turn-helix domain-containing protein [Shinella yambaruensis]MCJ8030070.1 helix-turn-helix domain-containing protein [Shinella yambaruensis]MCU7984355.1 helix-turn-helix domain-containing protein [Shinella yambaruensis]GLR54348.1 hypothetical protein GCM10007923_55650 [Shinella yambaruensis]